MLEPTMLITFSNFVIPQKYFVWDSTGKIWDGVLASIEDYDTILAIVDKYNVESLKISGGSKIILNKYKDRLKQKQIEKYGLKKIRVEIIE